MSCQILGSPWPRQPHRADQRWALWSFDPDYSSFLFWFSLSIIELCGQGEPGGGGKEGIKAEGVAGQCSQKDKNKRTANWDLSSQAPLLGKSVRNHPSSSRTPGSALAWTKWELFRQSPVRPSLGPPLCGHPAFPMRALPLPSGASHPSHLLRRQKGMVAGTHGWRAARGMWLLGWASLANVQSGLFCLDVFVVVIEIIQRWYVP